MATTIDKRQLVDDARRKLMLARLALNESLDDGGVEYDLGEAVLLGVWEAEKLLNHYCQIEGNSL